MLTIRVTIPLAAVCFNKYSATATTERNANIIVGGDKAKCSVSTCNSRNNLHDNIIVVLVVADTMIAATSKGVCRQEGK